MDRDPTASPTSFDMLGLHTLLVSLTAGLFVIKRKTARDRLSRALRAIAQWCQQHRRAPVSWQHAVHTRKLRAHDGYYGITGNAATITRFRHTIWQKWLNRRGGRSSMPWPRFARLEKRYPLPAAIAIHSIYRQAANP
jgi:hypothetical protein